MGVTPNAHEGGRDLIDQFEGAWRALCMDSLRDEPFYRPEVLRPFVEAFGPSKIVVVTAHLRGRLIALMPLVRETRIIGGLPARVLRAAGNVHTCRYDLVHADGMESVGVSAIWNGLLSVPGWDMLQLTSVPAGGALAGLARLARTQGYAAHSVRAATSPYVVLPQNERVLDSVLERLDSKFKANLRRRMRKLESRGGVRLVRTSVIDERLQQFYALERASWKGERNTAIDQDEQTRGFYDRLAKEAERAGWLSLYTLECAEKPIAMHYGLTYRGRYYVLKTAYDPCFREYSPGQLITLEILKDLAGRSAVELDFLGICMDWKRDWSPRLRPHADWYVFRGAIGAAVHLVHARARRTLGRARRRLKGNSSGMSERNAQLSASGA